MDKKNTIIGALLIAAAIGLMFWDARNRTELPPPVPQPVVAQKTQDPAPAAQATKAAEQPAPKAPRAPEKIFSLENATLKLNISSHNGAVKNVELKTQPTSLEDSAPVVFNEGSSIPALRLASPSGVRGVTPIPFDVDFVIESQTEDSAAQTRTLTLLGKTDGLEIRRIYTLSLNAEGEGLQDPYLVNHDIKIKRVSGEAKAFPLLVSTGMLPPTEGDRANIFLNASWYNGDDYEKCSPSEFKDSSGFLGLGAHRAAPDLEMPIHHSDPLSFIAVTNQYFASVVGFAESTSAIASRVFVYPQLLPKAEQINDTTLTTQAYAQLDVPALNVGQTANIRLHYFIGPKEYTRLAELNDTIDGIDNVVQFTSLFGFISVDWLCKILVVVMNALHNLLPASTWAWGWAILLMTLIVKGITWPLTMAQQRSAKKMQQFSEPMKQIREKYKDNPQKMQQEMMKLYRDNKINPLAGCFPVLIQIPIFFGMYCAFQTCAELRLQSFLWISDLSMPDLIPGMEDVTIPLIGAQIHLLPILMGATMLANMAMTPMPNAQPGQKNMFYIMMAIIPIICYSMPSALTLYWTMQNILTIFQTWLVRRSRDKDPGTTGKVDIIPPTKKKGRGKGQPFAR